jgi:hypothetical protein
MGIPHAVTQQHLIIEALASRYQIKITSTMFDHTCASIHRSYEHNFFYYIGVKLFIHYTVIPKVILLLTT